MKINKIIDHTILKATATQEEVKGICLEALEHEFASVCVNSAHVPVVAELLKNSEVKTCCVVGFPLGANLTSVKAFETKEAIKFGAEEIDMVINIGALKDKNDQIVYEDIKAVVEVAREKAIVKVIIESCLLTDEEVERACKIAVKAEADFVKTSTGFSTGGATKENVALIKRTVEGKAKVKASGGVRTYEDLLRMVEAGADRIGASSGVEIMKMLREEG